jgi:spore coat protein U-like protein
VSFSANTNNGINASGGNNRAALGANLLRYDFFTNATFATNWSTQSSKAITGTVTLGTGVPASASTVSTYYAKIVAAQTGLPQGVYTDTVTVSMTYGASNTNATPASIGVQITNVPGCEFTTPPSTIAFTYTAFSTSASTASTPFSARCTTSLPYTMALDATSGVVSGLRYTLSLSAASGTGNGAAQAYTITGNMQAGQAGTCATPTCTGTNAHSITISY